MVITMKRRVFIKLIILFALVFSSFPALGAVREYRLTIEQQDVTIRDKTAAGMTINGTIPGPTLYFQEVDLARIHVTNTMSVATSVHWHGLLVPPSMDGVPYVTQTPIQSGTTFTYEFPIRQTGTYWYHSHSELQEQSGLYGSIVIADSAHKADREFVLLLSDWTTDSPKSILRNLKRGSEWFSLDKGSAQSALGAAKAGRFSDYFKRELQRMPPMDIADVAYDFFLSNGKPETSFEANKGETIRLRVINGSATTYFHINFAGGPMTIVSARGERTTNIFIDQFGLRPFFKAIATAQTCQYTKPYPDPILWSADQMGIHPSNCLMIGDTTVDILSAKAAGAQSVGVLCGFGEQRELLDAGADMIIQSTSDLEPIVMKRNHSD